MFNWNVIILVGVSFIVARWIPFLAWQELQRRVDWNLSPIDKSCKQSERCVTSIPDRWCGPCRKKYSSICVGVQIIAACAAGVISHTYMDDLEAVIGVLFTWVLLLLSLTDLWSGIIPNRFTYTGIILFAILRIFVQSQSFVQHAFTFIVTLFGMMMISRVTRGFGGGDVKLLAMSAWIVEGTQILVAFFLAMAMGTGYVGWRWIRHRPIRSGEPFPFGPYLALGIFIAYVWGDGLLDWYLMWLEPIE